MNGARPQWYFEFDTYYWANRISPLASQQWSRVATTLDAMAWGIDLFSVGVVATTTSLGFFGATFEGTPVIGTAGAGAGWIVGETAVQPAIAIGNGISYLASGATVMSESMTGETRFRLTVTGGPSGIATADEELSFGPSTQVAYVSVLQSGLPFAETSFLAQSAVLANDLGWWAPPWGSIRLHSHYP